MADTFSTDFSYAGQPDLLTATGAANWSSTPLDSPDNTGNLIQTHSVGNDSAVVCTTPANTTDQYVHLKVLAATSSNAAVGALLRGATAATTFYRILVIGPLGASAVVQLRRYNAGTGSGDLATKTMSVSANAVLRTWITNSYVIHAAINDVEITTGGYPYDDSASGSKIASGSPGLMVFVDSGSATDAQLDDWGFGTGDGAASGGSPVLPTVNDAATITENVTMKMDLGKVNLNEAVTAADVVTMHMPISLRMEKLS